MPIKFKKKTAEQAAFADLGDAFIHEESWKRMEPDQLYAVTLGDIMAGKSRVMINLTVDRRPVYLVSNQEDGYQLRKKYPRATIIDMKQMLGLFKRQFEDGQLPMDPLILTVMEILPGSRVVDNKLFN